MKEHLNLSGSDSSPAENVRGLAWRARMSGFVSAITVCALLSTMLFTIATPFKTVSFLGQGFVYPIVAPKKSSGYGWRVHPIRRFSHNHSGIDLAAPEGTPIRAVAAGIVVFADPYAGYGNFVTIEHDKAFTTHYGHCNTLRVKPGQVIKAGQIIATVGSTGTSTGPHLHFEVRVSGQPQNPERFIPGLGTPAEG